MHFFSIDRSKDRPDQRVLLHRSYYASGVPRLMALCRLRGHKPVVDGYDSKYGPEHQRRARWVCCDRCGVRPQPQGPLGADRWSIGDRYTGALPGPWPDRPEGTLAAELIVGRSHSLGLGVTVGSADTENVLSAHLGLGPLGALYLSTERFGTWVQRRLNPTGYESKRVQLAFHHGQVWWELWARENERRATDPKWMHGNAPVDLRHYLLGPRQNHKVSETERVPAVVRMPEGDTHDVLVHLQQWETRRTRGRAHTYWLAQWDSKSGIPVRNHSWKGDETYSCSWVIEGVTPDNPRWPYILAAKAAEQCSRDRARYGYRAPDAA